VTGAHADGAACVQRTSGKTSLALVLFSESYARILAYYTLSLAYDRALVGHAERLLTADWELNEELSCDDLETYVSEDFQRSAVDVHSQPEHAPVSTASPCFTAYNIESSISRIGSRAHIVAEAMRVFLKQKFLHGIGKYASSLSGLTISFYNLSPSFLWPTSRSYTLHFRVDNANFQYSKVTRALQPVATCRQLPYRHKPAIAIVTSFSL